MPASAECLLAAVLPCLTGISAHSGWSETESIARAAWRCSMQFRWIRLLHPDRDGFINIEDAIPIYLAASGPKALAATGPAT